MSLKSRVEAAAAHVGINTQVALAEALGIKQPSLYALLAEQSPMLNQLQKISEITGVSFKWLRTGDPEEAPPWMDPVAVAKEAIGRLSDIDRLRLQAEMALDQADVDHEPDEAVVRMRLLRLMRQEFKTELEELEALAAHQMKQIRTMRAKFSQISNAAATDTHQADRLTKPSGSSPPSASTGERPKAAEPRQRYQIGDRVAQAHAPSSPEHPTA